MITNINAVVQKFIDEWKQSPFLWDTEMDIHVELASRLRAAFPPEQLKQSVYYKEYGKYVEVSLLSCGYPVEFDAAKESYCRPDIQIFKPAEDPANPPDSVGGKNWPALWVCEIKYKTEIGGDQNRKNREADISKLRRLSSGAEHCCILHLERGRSGAKESVYRIVK